MNFSPWLLCSIVLVGSLLSFEAGYVIGNRRRARKSGEDTSLGPMVTGVLGLLAFILAVSFSTAAVRHDQRKQNVLNDANAITTAWLRTYLVNEEKGQRIREGLREYTELRVHVARDDDLDALLARIDVLQQWIWTEIVELGRTSPNALTNALATSITAVFDLHEKRVNDSLYNRLGMYVWSIIIVIVLLGMLMLGVQGGLAGRKSYIGLVLFALALSAMLYLITDLDSPQSGLFRVSQQPMQDALDMIHRYE